MTECTRLKIYSKHIHSDSLIAGKSNIPMQYVGWAVQTTAGCTSTLTNRELETTLYIVNMV